MFCSVVLVSLWRLCTTDNTVDVAIPRTFSIKRIREGLLEARFRDHSQTRFAPISKDL